MENSLQLSGANKIDNLDNYLFDRTEHRIDPSYWGKNSKHGIVVSAHYRASQAGAQILKTGGNAIDAAVAVSAALGVVEPAASGLGGMTMMNIYLAKQKSNFIIEGPCKAPIKASPDIAAAFPRKSGYKAVAVPTNPAVLSYVLKKYGRFSPAQVLEPAILLAQNGYLMTPFQQHILSIYAKQIAKENSKAFLLNKNGKTFSIGEKICQPILAKTLIRLAKFGFEEFYHGETGSEIFKDMKKNGGFLCEDDFVSIPYPIESKSLKVAVWDWSVSTTPPPGGGLTLLEMLLLYAESFEQNFNPNNDNDFLLLIKVIQKARIDRIRYKLELTKEGSAIKEILSKSHIKKAGQQIIDDNSGSGETTHFNVIDKWGNIVTVTQSIERSYGAKVITASLGFLYNGFMKGFKIENKRHPHYLRPGAVARSNASPTLAFTPEKIYAVGSTGSERMASGIFQVLLRLRSQSGYEAVAAPRLHCTPDGTVQYEPHRFSQSILEAIKNNGYMLAPYADAWAFSAGGLHLACAEKEKCWGVADPRRDGAAFES